MCPDVIREKGLEHVTVEDLVTEVTPKGRGKSTHVDSRGEAEKKSDTEAGVVKMNPSIFYYIVVLGWWCWEGGCWEEAKEKPTQSH